MPRIRTIKPEFWNDEKLGELPEGAMLSFIGCFTYSDDYGVLKGNLKLLKSQIFPYKDSLRLDVFKKWIDALVDARMLIPLIIKDESYFYIRTFRSHQVIEKPSKTRACTEEELQAALSHDFTIKEHSTMSKGTVGEQSGSSRGIVGEYSPLEKEREKEEEYSSCPEIGISDVVSLPFEVPIPIPSKPKPKEKHYSAEGYSFAQWFRVLLPAERSVTKSDLVNWAITYDELIRIDKRTDADIRRVCKWARENSFWKDNFLSVTKLRDKNSGGVKYFEVFQIKMNSEKGVYNGRNTNAIHGNSEQLTDTLTREREDTADAIRAVKIALGEVD